MSRMGRPHEANVRKGFLERRELQAIVDHLPEDVKSVFEVACMTGWRVKVGDSHTSEVTCGSGLRVAATGTW